MPVMILRVAQQSTGSGCGASGLFMLKKLIAADIANNFYQ
jgi:hypothetical protein